VLHVPAARLADRRDQRDGRRGGEGDETSHGGAPIT
jgi:hypothetical protein